MSSSDPAALFESYWRSVCAKARRPVGGLLLPDERVLEIATGVFEAFLDHFKALPKRAEIGEFMLLRARREALLATAEARRTAADPELYAESPEHFYGANLNLAALQSRDGDAGFNDPEWQKLPAALRARAFVVLKRAGIPEPEREDLFSECLAALVVVRERDGRAPIEALTVFEEIIPLFSTMTHHRAVSWQRKQSTQKNRPNDPSYGTSLDDPDRHLEPQAHDEGPWAGLTFERIYDSCRECLSELEWHILTRLFVEADATRGDLAEDVWVLEQMEVSISVSLASKRRHLNRHLQSALDKLGACLREKDLQNG